ncbi:MAG: hypothetical protein ACLSHX_16755 [Suilimivivens sp.]
MDKKNDYIQLPPMKKDTSADVVSFIWEYMKLPEDVRNKVKSEMDEIHEHCRDSEFQKPDLYDIVSKEEVAGLEQSMQRYSLISSQRSAALPAGCMWRNMCIINLCRKCWQNGRM